MLLNKREIYSLQCLIDEEIDWNKSLISVRQYGYIKIDADEALREIKQCQERINILEGIDIKLAGERQRIDKLQEN